MIGYKTKANYWEAQFHQLKTREKELSAEVEELKAKLRKEIDVKAHRRIIYRKKYKRSCFCKENPDPQILSAPVIERLLPKSKLHA